jgi:hypothetical protein
MKLPVVKFDPKLATLKGDERMVNPPAKEPSLKLWLPVKGGEGSGNFEHAGRPGEVGGSGPGGLSDVQIRTWIGANGYKSMQTDAAEALKNGKSDPLIDGIRTSTDGKEIYRGIRIGENDKTPWVAGKTVQMMPQSFSKDEGAAMMFADPDLSSGGKKGVLFIVRAEKGGKVHAIDISEHVKKMQGTSSVEAEEEEVISGGLFRVDKVKAGNKITTVYMTQIGVF